MEQPCCVLDSPALPSASREGQRTLPKKSWQGDRESAGSSRAGEGQSERLCVREKPAGQKYSMLLYPQHRGLRTAPLRATGRWQPDRSGSRSEQRQRRAPDTRVCPDVGVGAFVVLTWVPKLSTLCEEIEKLRMAGEQKPSCNLLEQFILLAKGTSGSALTALINQVLEAPGVYVFGELLELTNVQELAEGSNAAYFQLLNLFAYGTYPDYVANKDNLPELTATQKNKLKHLTIVSLASRMKCIPYSVLLKDLDMRNLRELEDLIIEAVYTDIIQGKLDQRNQMLEVDFCIGRDIQKKDISNIVKTLQEWCDGCEAVLLGIEQQVLRANQYKENHHRTQQQVEMEVTNIKKTLKATASSSAQEMEQQLVERECPPHTEQRQSTKKMSKVKGLVSSRH
ncbi:COP9 signalosome complex subunit 7b isoform X1 [Coturnix japonica]|uniref:COP9 signalosome subunit 7B n=2 Tax=Coturnix japonica TaxID=93934 RepID=A0A8C2TSF7_COTJA|nr:COP9 signalosome complex subunit 7b isoform X1 [Coturnix japonica]